MSTKAIVILVHIIISVGSIQGDCSATNLVIIISRHRKNSIEIRDEMYRITDHSFLRCTTFGTTKQNLVFVVARRFF